ncbi:MAG: HAMP domain-containing histidine kinase [Defluviitaleaceae bacterium]|nr:HAMP domain-containing histidine kinase [Defluviitaleaceae bacterium]
MIIKRSEIERLSSDVRRIIDGEVVDLRDNLEGRLSILKNDIHTLAGRLNEQATTLKNDKIALADTLADISHQLKTPLTAMELMVELLEGAPPEKQAEFRQNLRQGLIQTSWLVNSLLKMAKLDSGTVEFNIVETTAKEIINAALQPLAVLLDIKNQRVEINGDIAIKCDKNWTAEALTNIIKNASEHSQKDSTIMINVGQNPICGWVTVADMGGGMTTAQIKNAFKRFDNSQKGTGIGLPLAFAIMQGQNGDIEIDGGKDGLGATFTLKFYKPFK